MINLEKNPSLGQKYNLTSGYEAVFEIGDRYKVVSLQEIFEGTAFSAEAAYTSAIQYTLNDNPPIVYYIEGHKEAKLDSEVKYLKSQIERDGYIIKTLNIAFEGRIPDDASMIISIGAKSEFSKSETDIIERYLENGGKAIILTSAYNTQFAMEEMNNLLQKYNIYVKNDIAIEPERNFVGTKNIAIPIYETSSEISKKLSEQSEFYMSMPDTRSIDILTNNDTISTTPILTTTFESWGETDFEQYSSKEIKKDEFDNIGPLNLAVYSSKIIEEGKEMQLVVIGGDIFVYDTLLSGTRTIANIEFISNAMTKLNPQKNMVTIKSKPLDIKQIILPYNKQKTIFFATVIVIPFVVLTIGLIVWIRRKNLWQDTLNY